MTAGISCRDGRVVLLLCLFTALAQGQLRITTTTVPGATQYQSYIAVLAATGGTTPYTWSVVTSTNTSLPEGMTLDPSSGIVSATQVYGQGGYSVEIQVTDSASPSHATATKLVNFGVHSDDGYGGCQMFPPDSIYNQRVDKLPVDTVAAHQIPSAYLSLPLHPDFGTGFYPVPGGIPFLRVPSNQTPSNVHLSYGGQIEGPGTYSWPVPPWPLVPFEGTAYGPSGEDHHILVLQTGTCKLYEAYNDQYVPSMYNAGTNTWSMGGGVHYDLSSNEIAQSNDTLDNGAQDSPGIPMVPLLIRYSEVPLGTHHPLRISFPSPTNWFVWPGTGCCTGSGPPQGLLYRLKASVNWQATCPTANYPQAATLLQAIQQYGAYMSDHGSAGYFQGVPDDRWDDDDLACIKRLHVSDLEVVDNSALEISAISGQTKPYVVPAALSGGTVGNSYNVTFSEVGGTPSAIQWSSTGILPPGLLLNSTTGVLSGTITSSNGAPFNFTITATDTNSAYASAPQAFTIGVTGASIQLAISKTHTGSFLQGQSGATYTVVVSNPGTIATTGLVTVTENVPTAAGMTLASMSGTGWTCPPGGNTCTRSDVLNPGGTYPQITVTVNLSKTASSQATNQVSVSGGGSSGASAQDVTTVLTKCDLNQDGSTNAPDVQRMIKEALGTLTPSDDLNADARITLVDVQIVIAAALNHGCSAN